MKELKLSLSKKTEAKILTEDLKIPIASCEISIDAISILPKVKNHGLKLDAIFLSAAEYFDGKRVQNNRNAGSF